MAKKDKAVSVPDEQDWQADSDMRTLIEAEKIKKDKPRLRRAMRKATEQREALAKITAKEK